MSSFVFGELLCKHAKTLKDLKISLVGEDNQDAVRILQQCKQLTGVDIKCNATYDNLTHYISETAATATTWPQVSEIIFGHTVQCGNVTFFNNKIYFSSGGLKQYLPNLAAQYAHLPYDANTPEAVDNIQYFVSGINAVQTTVPMLHRIVQLPNLQQLQGKIEVVVNTNAEFAEALAICPSLGSCELSNVTLVAGPAVEIEKITSEQWEVANKLHNNTLLYVTGDFDASVVHGVLQNIQRIFPGQVDTAERFVDDNTAQVFGYTFNSRKPLKTLESISIHAADIEDDVFVAQLKTSFGAKVLKRLEVTITSAEELESCAIVLSSNGAKNSTCQLILNVAADCNVTLAGALSNVAGTIGTMPCIVNTNFDSAQMHSLVKNMDIAPAGFTNHSIQHGSMQLMSAREIKVPVFDVDDDNASNVSVETVPYIRSIKIQDHVEVQKFFTSKICKAQVALPNLLEVELCSDISLNPLGILKALVSQAPNLTTLALHGNFFSADMPNNITQVQEVLRQMLHLHSLEISGTSSVFEHPEKFLEVLHGTGAHLVVEDFDNTHLVGEM